MQTQYETLLVNVDGPIVEVLLNRPEKRNAISFQMVKDFNSILAEAKYDRSVRVVTVCGEGKVFSAGHDLADVKGVAEAREKGEQHPEVDPLLPETPMRSWYFPKPLIAGVHGFVGPEAMKTIATFDFVLAASGTRFSYEQARVRTSAPGGNPLVFQLPMRVWQKLILMGGWFTAEQALDFHFVQRVVEETDLRQEVRSWAEHLAKMPSGDVQIAKQGIHRQYELMGMLTMEMLHNRLPAPPANEADQFWDQVGDGAGTGDIRQALADRDAGVDSSVTRV
jgi:enoyl-CoA hydratase/carnithine racemase